MDRFLIGPPPDPASTIVVGSGLVDRVGELLPPRPSRTQAVVVHQPTVAAVAGRVAASLAGAGLVVDVVEAPDGEAAKTLGAVGALYRRFNDLRLDRGGLVAAVGGGALCDAAGFAAATYLRGIEAAYVPTTLLAGVDAAIGGKTGINVEGKNLVGAFAHPRLVAVDLDVLRGLPARLLAEGHVEALKTGYVGDAGLVDHYRRRGPEVSLEEVVPRAVAVKAKIVEADFREGDRRAHLNLGHTVGHAVETATGRSHGEAVAVGLVAAAAASAKVTGFDWVDDVRRILEGLGMPTSAPDADPRRVLALMGLDKKRSRGAWRMVLLEEVGVPRVVDVDDATVRAALDAVGIAIDDEEPRIR
ncbi:MAG TPA: iron-containing alcohol dehydrogenase [Actinobacteria bacterium]|nr:iron-containing alcohol dehydrogenase [Actinomycetota bacterium]